jgi:asparagine synthetase A
MSLEERKTMPSDDFLTKMRGIDVCKKTLFASLEKELNLIRVSAPLFIPTGTGI